MPGTTIVRSETPPNRSRVIQSGTAFAIGLTGKGSLADARVPARSFSEWTSRFGARADAPYLYDAAEAFFREGGSLLFTSRVLGPSALEASLNLSDGSGTTLVVKAKSPGAWGNGATGGLSVDVDVSGSDFTLNVYLNAVLVETSPTLADQAAALAWAQYSSYITLSAGANSGDPVNTVGAQNLTGGTDDRANAVDAHYLAALTQFTEDLGPGQVACPGGTTAARQNQLLDHAATYNRIALLDGPDTGVKATALSAAGAITSANARFGGMFGPWIKVPGVTPGTFRTIPPSLVVAGIIARNDGSGHTPNEAAAGDLGQSLFGLDVSQVAWSKSDRGELNTAGFNVVRFMDGGVRVYGFRSLADPVTEDNYINLANMRLYMEIAAKADAIAERYVFRQLDGQRHTVSEYGGALTGMLLPYHAAGALYGETASEAFNVDVGEAVNTDATMAAGQLNAKIALRMSPFAEDVIINLTKTRTTEAVA